MIAILELTPIDLYLESNEEQKLFQENIQRVINQIRDYDVQFTIKVTNMKSQDLKDHFDHLRKYRNKFNIDVEEKRKILVEKYITELSNILSDNFIPRKKIYLCINAPISLISKEKNKYTLTEQTLTNKTERIIGMFFKCQIKLNPVDILQVKLLLKESFRF